MSIDNKLTYLQQTKEGIKTAIQNKGVDVSDADTFRSYAEKIALIEGGDSEIKENFTIVGKDVRVDQNGKASDFSETSLIEPIFETETICVDNLVMKLRCDDFSNSFQAMMYGFFVVNWGYVGIWANTEFVGARNLLEEKKWTWIQVVLNHDTNTYSQYLLKDYDQIYTVNTLPDINNWTLVVSNITKTIEIPVNSFLIGFNNFKDPNPLRGIIDLNNTKITLTDGTIWTPYSEKSTPTVSGDTTWAYHTGQAVAGDKVILTKVNSFVTPDSSFCNGFRPYLIMNGYAYGVVGDATSSNFNTRRQIVDGVISSSDSVSITTYSSLSWKTDLVSFYLMNGTCTAETLLTNNASTCNLVVPFAGTKQFDYATGGSRVFICETGIPQATSGYGRFFDYTVPAVISGLVPPLYTSSFCFEDSNHDFYWFNANITYIYKWNRATNTTEQIGTKPTIIQQTSANLLQNNQLFIQTKDFKYLLNSLAYVDLDVENNTYTIKDYPAVIKNAMGDRTLYCMQVFYDGCFSIQLSDGTTLICKYTNSMEDVEIKEIVEPIYIEGDETIYQRQFSPNRMYWFNRPLYSNKVVAVPLASNPAGAYNKQNAKSDYVAFPPSKDRFNSTVLTGFLTGETEPDAEGRQMVEVKTVSGI